MNSAPPKTVVKLELGLRSYEILIGSGILKTAGAYIKRVAPTPRAIIITDENVAACWLKTLQHSLISENFEIQTQILPPGEQTKSMDQIKNLTDWMLDNGADRKTTIIALGGGVIGDLAGFAAAITLRGMPFVQIPTTLLAQVDSSVGGKTAIDTRHGKNMIGAFHQPSVVLADTDTLSTLPKRQLIAGYAEVVKYGLINDLSFFEWCELHGREVLARDPKKIRHAIEVSCHAKAAIVTQDEFESNERALLNLGHTFGHAFEAELGFSDTLLHGEAVAIGILSAFELSSKMGFCSGQEVERVRRHFTDMDLPTSLEFIPNRKWEAHNLLAHMTKDKKWEHGNQTFILARGIGKSFLHRNVNTETLHLFLSDMLPT